MNFPVASKTCSNESAHLASIHSAEENAFVRGETFCFSTEIVVFALPELTRITLSKAKFISLGSTRIWLGLQLLDWRWQWIDETSRDFTDWETDMPYHLNKEKWASVRSTRYLKVLKYSLQLLIDKSKGTDDQRTWRTEKRDNLLMFICKRKS